VRTWPTTSRTSRCRLELLSEDTEKVISAKEWGRKLLLSSNLSKGETRQVLMFAGGAYHPERIEAVLRKMHPHIGDTDRRQGRVAPARAPSSASSRSSLTSALSRLTGSTGSSRSTTRSFGSQGNRFRRPGSVHFTEAEDALEQVPEDEVYEEEAPEQEDWYEEAAEDEQEEEWEEEEEAMS